VSEPKSLFAEIPEPEPAASGSSTKGQEPSVGSGLAQSTNERGFIHGSFLLGGCRECRDASDYPMKAQMASSDHTRFQTRRKLMPKTSEFSRRQFVASALATAALAALPAPSRANAKMQQITGDEIMNLTPYILFDGNCHQAMEFYKSCFGGELTSMKVKDSPAKDYMPAVQQEKIINARLKSGNVEISASDWLRLDQTRIRGNTVCLYLSGGTFQELKALFEKLSEEAEVTDPLKEMFFGVYGALNDKFGVRWMFQTAKNGA
jgi:PhnB protein